MARQTVKASNQGIRDIREAYKLQGFSQSSLAESVPCTRQTIGSLLKGNPVDRHIMLKLCNVLDLDWETISTDSKEEPQIYQLDELVREVRSQAKQYIDEYCSTIRVLNMTQKIELGDIYTNVNILEKLTRSRQLRFEGLLELSRDKFELLARGAFVKEGVPGLEAVQEHSKLMVFGKPGAGKTTFLKYVALQCSAGALFPKLIPLFIPLKEWAEAPEKVGLTEHLINLFASYGIAPNAQVKQGLLDFLMNRDRDSAQERVNLTAVEEVLREGRVLLLLDGLDEVRDVDSKRVSREIEDFARQFPKNRYVVTCRMAAKDYVFEQFTEVEVADFNQEQVGTFISNWFGIRKLPQVAERLTKRLAENEPIRELACSPILLTLLCLVFEESGELSPNRAELYKRGLDLLLSRWDATRGIERDQIYQRLSLRAKEEMLSEIAFDYFERGEYFFQQESVTEEISACLYNLPGADEDEADLRVTARAVLKSVEAQHGLLVERANGIYSFSHLTFQEYLTARWIRESRQGIELKQLVKHLEEPQWREVFLLTSGMLNREGANQLLLLMQCHIEQWVREDKKIQELFAWLSDKVSSVKEIAYKAVTVRAFYIYMSTHFIHITHNLNIVREFENVLNFNGDIDIAVAQNLSLTSNLKFKQDSNIETVRSSALELTRILARISELKNLKVTRTFARELNFDKILSQSKSLEQELKQLQTKLPALQPTSDQQKLLEEYRMWWKANGQDWSNQLRQVIVDYHHTDHDWQFSPEQIQLLNRYLEGNKLLADCLNADCYVSRDVRQHIEATMLMPQSFIDDYRAQHPIDDYL